MSQRSVCEPGEGGEGVGGGEPGVWGVGYGGGMEGDRAQGTTIKLTAGRAGRVPTVGV